jgi:hypothetical protein
MKTILKIIFLLVLICVCSVPIVLGEESSGAVTFTFKLEKIPTKSSNQIALWIEDESGKYVKTVFATQFTARGGFKKRPQALSEWVKVSDLVNASPAEVDAVSAPTQMAGMAKLTWNCIDSAGEPVAPGEYVYKMEGNLFRENRVLWEGKIMVGRERNTSIAEPQYYPLI